MLALGGAANTLELGFGTAAGGALSLGLTPAQVTATGQDIALDAGVTLGVTAAAIGVAGQPVGLLGGLSLGVTPAQLVVTEVELGCWQSGAWQYTAVTDLSKIGLEITLFDGLSGVTPEIGDVWRTPVLSQDGGAVTVFGVGTYMIGPPTSGPDVLEDVMYLDVSLQVWHGPTDYNVNDQVHLDLTSGQIAVAGQDVSLLGGRSLDLTPAQVAVLGLGVGLTTSGVLELVLTPATLAVAASNVELLTGVELGVNPGATVVTGLDVELVTMRVLELTPGLLAALGLNVQLTGEASAEIPPRSFVRVRAGRMRSGVRAGRSRLQVRSG